MNDGTHPTLPKGACIPVSWGNKDYQEYLAWTAKNDADAADTIDYMAQMRSERDSRMNKMQWRIQRNYRQVANGETPDDDDVDMAKVYDYMKDLANMPADNSGIDTKEKYKTATWPVAPK